MCEDRRIIIYIDDFFFNIASLVYIDMTLIMSEEENVKDVEKKKK